MERGSRESAIQVFSRMLLNKKPKLIDLYPEIFNDTKVGSARDPHSYINNPPPASVFLKPKDMVEITSDSVGCGKTVLLMELIAKVILPTEFNGKNGGVLLFDTDQKFQIFHLMAILEKFIRQNWNNYKHNNDLQENKDQILKDFIEISLQNLTIFKCKTSMDFDMALITVEEMLTVVDNKYVLLAIDSITAFYWIDPQIYEQNDNTKIIDGRGRYLFVEDSSAAGFRRDDGLTIGPTKYLNNLLRRLETICNENHCSLCYTKPLNFEYNKFNYNNNRINYKIILRKSNNSADSTSVCVNSIDKSSEPKSKKKKLSSSATTPADNDNKSEHFLVAEIHYRNSNEKKCIQRKYQIDCFGINWMSATPS